MDSLKELINRCPAFDMAGILLIRQLCLNVLKQKKNELFSLLKGQEEQMLRNYDAEPFGSIFNMVADALETKIIIQW